MTNAPGYILRISMEVNVYGYVVVMDKDLD
jgi:hypothetical protein